MKNKILSIVWVLLGLAGTVFIGLFSTYNYNTTALLFLIVSAILAFIGLLAGIMWIGQEYFGDKKATKDGTLALVAFIVAIALPLSAFILGECFSNGQDFDLFGYESSSYSSENNNKTHQSHECYVCGNDASLKYGSHYYCNTHWAMVKTVDEAD